MKRFLSATAVLWIGVTFGCGDGDGLVEPPPADPDVHTVIARAAVFSPVDITIPVGERVRWFNEQSIFHTITPIGHDEWSEATVNNAGETFVHRFDDPGEFDYECTVHPGMVGVIRVE
jgi:plastocyanin